MSSKRAESIPARPIDDHTILTQYGRESPGLPTFRSGPREHEDYQSMVAGRRTVAEMARFVMGRPARKDDRVRYTTAGELRAAGFVVTSEPRPWNGDHVGVTLPGEPIPWEDEKRNAFEFCFPEEPVCT